MIVAKGILNINATAGTDLDGNNVLNFSYEVKDNYDNDEGTFDSHYAYSYFIPVKDISINIAVNFAGNTESVEINFGKNQITFTEGEYYDIDSSQTLNVGNIYGGITAVIYA
jgi:hypothetical protein